MLLDTEPVAPWGGVEGGGGGGLLGSMGSGL